MDGSAEGAPPSSFLRAAPRSARSLPSHIPSTWVYSGTRVEIPVRQPICKHATTATSRVERLDAGLFASGRGHRVSATPSGSGNQTSLTFRRLPLNDYESLA